MEDTRVVRELSLREQPRFRTPRTGDVLPDGTVVLCRRDMDRMGLDALRNWLRQTAVEGSAVIGLADTPPRVGTLLTEEYEA